MEMEGTIDVEHDDLLDGWGNADWLCLLSQFLEISNFDVEYSDPFDIDVQFIQYFLIDVFEISADLTNFNVLLREETLFSQNFECLDAPFILSEISTHCLVFSLSDFLKICQFFSNLHILLHIQWLFQKLKSWTRLAIKKFPQERQGMLRRHRQTGDQCGYLMCRLECFILMCVFSPSHQTSKPPCHKCQSLPKNRRLLIFLLFLLCRFMMNMIEYGSP